MKLNIISSACLLALCTVNAQAQTATGKEVVIKADAERPDLMPNSALNPYRLSESSLGHTQVITREEIEDMRPVDAFDILNMASGVVSTPASNKKSFSSLTIRGDTNFRWIVDGVTLDPTTASKMMRSLPVAMIQEMKVVRGGSALTLGPMVNTENPAGGAGVDGFIVVRTRKPMKTEGAVRLAVESNSSDQESVWLGKTLSGENAKGYVAGLISHSRSGNPGETLDNGKSYNVARAVENGLFKTGFETGGFSVDLMAYADDGYFQIPNANSHYAGASVGWKVDPTRTELYSISGSRSWNSQNTTLFSLSKLQSKLVLNPHTATPNTHENNTDQVSLRHTYDLGDTRFMAGGDYKHWDSPTGQNYYEGVHREEKTTGWFAQVEQKLLNGRLNLDGSYRQDQVLQVHGLNYTFANPRQAPTQARLSGVELPAAKFLSLGGAYSLTENWRVNARYGHNQQPNNSSMLGYAGVLLSGEKANKWEFGLQGAVSKVFNPEINYFYREVENEKSIAGYSSSTATCVVGGGVTVDTINGASSTNYTPCFTQADTTRAGVELVATGMFAERSNYRLSWTHFTELSDSIKETTPSNMAELTIKHGFGRYTLTGAVKYVSKYKGSSNGTVSAVPYSGYTRYDLGLGYGWRWNGNPVQTTIYGKNLANTKYETALGIQDVGRVVGVELLASF